MTATNRTPSSAPSTLLTFCLSVLIGCAFLIGGCASEESGDPSETSPAEASSGDLELSALWARPAVQDGNGAVYFTLLNGTDQPDTLLSARASVADTVEVHQTEEQGEGMSGMRPVEALVVAPNERLMLEQGGRHLMLVGLTRTLSAGDTLSLDLRFARSGSRSIDVPVRAQAPDSE